MIRVVTAYVPVKGHPRKPEEYFQLGAKLVEAVGDRLVFVRDAVENCWLHHYIRKNKLKPTHSVADNPAKNSLEYHIVQAQKTAWLADAARMDGMSSMFVWIDIGIFHIPGITIDIVRDYLDRVENEQAIAIPGCWGKDEYPYNDQLPYWRFCGGLMAVPRFYTLPLFESLCHQYAIWLETTNNVTFDVNMLARLEMNDPDFPVWWYQADHDATMFTNYRLTENADGQKVRGVQSRYC